MIDTDTSKKTAWRAPRPNSQRNNPMNCWWSMLYYYAVGRDHGTSPQLMQGFEALTKIGFDEDKCILEAIQAARLKDARDPAEWEVSVKSDAAGVQARRALARRMDRETDGAAQ